MSEVDALKKENLALEQAKNAIAIGENEILMKKV